jgi:hypothetical protein
VTADHMNLLQIGLTAKHFSYPPGSLVITDEPIAKKQVKLFDTAHDGLSPLAISTSFSSVRSVANHGVDF